jgi:hypothetical protein
MAPAPASASARRRLTGPVELTGLMGLAGRAALAAVAAAVLGSSVAGAQLPPPVPRALPPVGDPSMVIDDRGAPLEVLPTQRATPVVSSSGSGHIAHQVTAVAASAPIGPQQLGVVFNHALQQQGYISGEITFKMKDALAPGSDFGAAQYPGLRKLLNPNIYVVVARTPAEFVQVVKRLQQRTDVEWVEPIVNYGRSGAPPVRR